MGKCGRLISVAISGYVRCVLLPIITPHLEEPEFLRLLEYLDTENILLDPGKECVLGPVFPTCAGPCWDAGKATRQIIKVLNAPRWALIPEQAAQHSGMMLPTPFRDNCAHHPE